MDDRGTKVPRMENLRYYEKKVQKDGGTDGREMDGT